MSGTAPAPNRPLSGFEQGGVSGIRPGQAGNPLPSPQSGARDGKANGKTDPSKSGSGQSAKGQTGKPGDKATTGKNGTGKEAPGRDDSANAATLACINCATILQVRTVRMKPSPSWMLNSDTRAPDVADSQSSDLPTRGQGTSIGTSANRSIINADSSGSQFSKRMYEVTLLMDSGLTRKIHLEMLPAFNLGSKVRVTGNRLLPR
jgi:hypothetical protein